MSILSEEFKLEVRRQAHHLNHGIRRAWYVLTTTKAQREANAIAADKRFRERMRALLNDPERQRKIADNLIAHNAFLDRFGKRRG